MIGAFLHAKAFLCAAERLHVSRRHSHRSTPMQGPTAVLCCCRPASETRGAFASPSSSGRAHKEHPGSKQATREHTEEGAHRGERDAASY